MLKFFITILTSFSIFYKCNGFECPGPGHFNYDDDPGNLVQCIQTDNGKLIQEFLFCPENSIYSSVESMCVSNNELISFQANDGVCKENGRFPDQDVNDCSSYFYCANMVKELHIRKVFCPNGTLFSNEDKTCVVAENFSCDKKVLESICTGNGRFVDQNSQKCSTYILCTELINGTYTSAKQNCPSGTVFSPNVKRCVLPTEYQCPSEDITEPTEILSTTDNVITDFICHRNGRFPDTDTENCSTYFLCTELSDGSYASGKQNCPSGTVFSPNDKRCVLPADYLCPSEDVPEPTEKPTTTSNVASNIVCQENGRLTDFFSVNCSTYILCTKLSDGSYVSGQRNCPSGTVFSPNERRCVLPTEYQCPSEGITKSTEIPNITPNLIPDFKCQGNGRYSDPDSDNCSTYILCTELNDGSYTSAKRNCPSDTVFSPNDRRCVLPGDYQCASEGLTEPTEIITTTTNMIPDIVCQGSGRFIDTDSKNCSTYIICTELSDGTYASGKRHCPSGTVFSPNNRQCVLPADHLCQSEIQPEELKTTTVAGISDILCQANGRFTDPDSGNCSTYILCTEISDGTYALGKQNCPSETVFSPNDKRCVSPTEYQCSSEDITKLPEISTTTSNMISDIVCQESGRFIDPDSNNCSTYILCTELSDGTYASGKRNCPSGTVFSLNNKRCVLQEDYNCPSKNQPTEIPNTTANVITDFICQENGRFADKDAGNCSTYILCTELSDGTYAYGKQNCPPGTVFSPNNKRCMLPADYQCPSTEITVPTEIATIPSSVMPKIACQENGRFIDPDSDNCTTYILCTELSDGTYVSGKRNCPSGTVFSLNDRRCVLQADYKCLSGNQPTDVPNTTANVITDFLCHRNGRFPDKASDNCSTYILCTELSDGTYASAKRHCPSETVFSINDNRCVLSAEYQCPSNKIAESTEISTPTSNVISDIACQGSGRYKDLDSDDCSTYILCTELSDGTFASGKRNCPSGTVFSPNERRCVLPAEYLCQDNSNKSNSIVLSEIVCQGNEVFVDLSVRDCSFYYECSAMDNGRISVARKRCPIGTVFALVTKGCVPDSTFTCNSNSFSKLAEDIDNFCPSEGLFQDKYGTDCSTYLACKLNFNGIMQSEILKCPNHTWFSFEKRACVIEHDISCNLNIKRKNKLAVFFSKIIEVLKY